jgi:hypothetical protein
METMALSLMPPEPVWSVPPSTPAKLTRDAVLTIEEPAEAAVFRVRS